MPKSVEAKSSPKDSAAPGPSYYDPLFAYARTLDSVTLTFVSAIGMARSSSRLSGRAGFGLGTSDYRAMLDRYFPGAERAYLTPAIRRALESAQSNGTETDEFEDLVRLLLEYQSQGSPENRWLAYAIAACCMGDEHLWQDMGLADRQALSDLMAEYFSELNARNTGRMRWKKFLYKQLCERDGAFVCRSPSCAECSEYANCFGSEEDGTWQ